MDLPPAIVARLDAKREELAREERLLDVQRAEMARVERRVELLQAELAGWEGAASEFAALLDVSPRLPAAGPAMAQEASGGHRSIRKMWRDILAASAAQYPAAVTLDGFLKIAHDLGTPTTRNTLRSQMSNYKGQGLLEAVGYGQFRLTPEGARLIGVTLPVASTNGMPKPADLAPAPDLLGVASPAGDNIHHEQEGGEKE